MVRKILVGVAALCTLYFIVTASYSLYQWSGKTHRAWATVEMWRVIELGPSKFAIEAEYSFTHEGQSYSGMTRFARPYHYNRPAAEREIQRKIEDRSVAFYDPSHPNRSALERFFPLKNTLYAMLTLGVFLYFVLLDRVFLQQRVQKA